MIYCKPLDRVNMKLWNKIHPEHSDTSIGAL